MPRVLRRSNNQIGSVSTARLIAIGTATATQVVAGSATVGVSIMNNGPATISWGDAGVLASSSGVLFPYTQYEWLDIGDSFSRYFIASSVQSRISWIEYRPGGA